MNLDEPLARAVDHWPTALAVGVLLLAVAAVCSIVVRRTSGAVLTAGIGALVCTIYTADTSWRFAEHRLGMVDPTERLVMFAAGEIALLACAVMARANKRATVTDSTAGTPGVPGVLVWCITGVQIIPAFTESGAWGGLVRAFFGPIMAGLQWHLAMGLEIRVTRPEALSTGLPAQIGAELRERLLSYLGLATRNRTAEQISRDRATARAVRLGSRRWLGPWGRAALAASLTRSGASLDGQQRHILMQQLAGRRSASDLRTVPIASPWVPQPVPEPYPATPLGVTGAELRRMEPFDAVLRVYAAHRDSTPGEVASLCTEYGVPVSETQVRLALRTVGPASEPAVPSVPERPELDAVPEPVPVASEGEYNAPGLHFDLTTEPQVRPEFACTVPAAAARTRPTRTEVHVRVPDLPGVLAANGDTTRTHLSNRRPEERAVGAEQARTRTQVDQVPAVVPVPKRVPKTASTAGTGDLNALLAHARTVDAEHRRTHSRPASIHHLKRELRVGQPKAQQIRELLDGDNS